MTPKAIAVAALSVITAGGTMAWWAFNDLGFKFEAWVVSGVLWIGIAAAAAGCLVLGGLAWRAGRERGLPPGLMATLVAALSIGAAYGLFDLSSRRPVRLPVPETKGAGGVEEPTSPLGPAPERPDPPAPNPGEPRAPQPKSPLPETPSLAPAQPTPAPAPAPTAPFSRLVVVGRPKLDIVAVGGKPGFKGVTFDLTNTGREMVAWRARVRVLFDGNAQLIVEERSPSFISVGQPKTFEAYRYGLPVFVPEDLKLIEVEIDAHYDTVPPSGIRDSYLKLGLEPDPKGPGGYDVYVIEEREK